MSTRGPTLRSSSSHDLLGVSRFDRVAGGIVAGLCVAGFAVAVLFIIWLTRRAPASTVSVPVRFSEAQAGSGEGGNTRGFEEPAASEVASLLEPNLEDIVATVLHAAKQAAQTDTLDVGLQGAGAAGDMQQGPGGDGLGDVIPPWERWEIRYDAQDLAGYARQLDYFGIELAATGGGIDEIEYAFQLSAPEPKRRSSSPTEEDRLYLTWRSGRLQRADGELLQSAGIRTAGRLLVQFYPDRVVDMLLELERKHAGERSVGNIRRTTFGVRQEGGEFVFFVIDQQYRREV